MLSASSRRILSVTFMPFECGTPAASIHVSSLNPVVSTTSVSPSERPMDSPFHSSSANLENFRPSMKIYRHVCDPPSYMIAM